MSEAENTAKPLAAKLGFELGDSVYVETTPAWYSEFADANGLDLTPGLPATHAHIFCAELNDLTDFLQNNDLSDVEKSLWLSWPKKTSGVKTDLGEDDLRTALLPLNWVDTKAAAIDETWSGLKFLRRKNVNPS